MNIYELLPKDHFGKLMERVLTELHAGESVCVYGMPGIGRTFFANQAKLLIQESGWADKVIHLEPLSFDNSLSENIKDQLLSSGRLNKKSFSEDLKKYLQSHKLVIILDYIERAKNKRRLLNMLADLQRLHPSNISVLTTCNSTLLTNPKEYIFRTDYFADSFYTLPLFDVKGATRIILQMKKLNGWNVDTSLARSIYKLGGGNPALTKSLSKAVDVLGKDVLSKPQELCDFPPLKIRLDELLHMTITQSPANLQKLLIVTKQKRVFSDLLKKYIENFSLANLDLVFPELSKLERKILSFFMLNEGKVIDKDRISFWMGMTDEKYSLWAIYKLISRLKQKISNSYNVSTIKGKGYCLTKSGSSHI